MPEREPEMNNANFDESKTRNHGAASGATAAGGPRAPRDAYADLLVRDSLQDSGVVPSPGYPYMSPDIICTQQTTYSDPSGQFGSSSYYQDPNLPVINKQNNYFYVRAKNLGTRPRDGTVYVYWSKASLLLTPDQWFGQPLPANVGGKTQSYNTLPEADPNRITVTAAPFYWTPVPVSANDHFCFIGAVSTEAHPWPPVEPPAFPDWDSFVMWVRNNQNICWRNLSLVTNPNAPEWDRVDNLSNSWSEDVPLLVRAVCGAVPINTQITLKCAALDIDTSKTITSPDATVYSQGVTCPANFNGYIETIAKLPSGATWPSGAKITTTALFGTQSNRPVAVYGARFGRDEKHPHVLHAKSLTGDANGRLVAVGNCATGYQASG